jgi:DNA-binding GntR family transcriptional regulator
MLLRPAAAQSARTSPADLVRERLLKAVLEQRLPPGARLPEDEIAGICGVSRTIVRAALQALAHDGVVVAERHRGAFVAEPSPRAAREVFEARALLEPPTARAAAERADAEAIAQLRRHLDAEHAALAAGENGRAVYLSGAFHEAIAAIARHETIAALLRGLIARSSLIVALYWRRRDALCERHAHGALVDALEAGDGAEAESLMKSHLTDLVSGLDLGRAERPKPDLAAALAADIR